MLKYVLKQFFNNKKSFILIVILLITFIITSISPYLTGLFVDFLISKSSRRKFLLMRNFRPLTPPCVPFGTRRFNQLNM